MKMTKEDLEKGCGKGLSCSGLTSDLLCHFILSLILFLNFFVVNPCSRLSWIHTSFYSFCILG